MKTKPILITAGVLVLLAGAFLFIRSRNLVKPQTTEINQFLYAFSNQINEGRTDSILADFDVNTPPRTLKKLINLLIGKSELNSKDKPLASIHLNVDASTVKIINSDLIMAYVPVKLSHASVSEKWSVLTLKIHQLGPHQFKIIQIDANEFLTDFYAYESLIKTKILSDKDLYSPITLKAFETAKQLKSKYDSVVWFAHLGNKTYFYVVKGKWDIDKDMERSKDSVIDPYKMGLVGPDLKEIVPVEYDLIHNINGTFPGMVEVEKDNKKGFFDLNGKITVPVNYNQIFPIDDESNLAVLKSGEDYFYLKKDMSISEKVDLKMSDFFSKIKMISSQVNLYKDALSVVTEYNSRDIHGAIYISPSYLAELNMISKWENFKNPLRKIEYEDVHANYNISFSNNTKEADNWFLASFYKIRDYYVGGRSEFYEKKNVVIVDKKNNRVFTNELATDLTWEEDGGESFEGTCDVNTIKSINDTLFEVKSGAILNVDLYDTAKYVFGGPSYSYFIIKDNKLIELKTNRKFGFTKYVKMDDSYVNSCYVLKVGPGNYYSKEKQMTDHVTPEMLRYMKNEIYADYRYQFKDKRWVEIFQEMPSYYVKEDVKPNTTVDDSLTAIDKYNINWINQKLKSTQEKSLASR
jgi:hypothetical protein